MVDCHSHLTLPGGSHWIERGGDTPEQLLRYAEHNAKLQTGAGVRWARDVGAPVGVDPVDGRERALRSRTARPLARPPRVPLRARGGHVGDAARRSRPA